VSITSVHGAIHLARRGQVDSRPRDATERHHVGQQLTLHVTRRLDQRTYMVSFGGEQHVLESSVHLAVGSRVRAVVAAMGDQLELRYVDAIVEGGGEEPSGADGASALEPTPAMVAQLEARYRMTLDAADHSLLESAVNRAADGTAMALGGLYLAKLGVPISDEALQAMHDVQQPYLPGGAPPPRALTDISALVTRAADGDSQSTQDLAQVIADAVPDAASQSMSFDMGGANTGDSGSQQDREDLARLFLNLQDGGSVGYRYGTLPVIVGGQLVELDLVVLQQRMKNEASPLRRLVMTLRTQSFGQVQVEARALDNRLVVTFTGEAATSAEDLGTYKEEVRGLLARLGWSVEGIGYQLDPQPGRAARHIIDHVLLAGTIDKVF